MKIKTSDAIGHVLDWLVSRAIYPEADMSDTHIWLPCGFDDEDEFLIEKYSTDCSIGHPIIEQEKISVMHILGSDHWMAGIFVFGERIPKQSGSTALMAAMRCFVASRLGDEVEVPTAIIYT